MVTEKFETSIRSFWEYWPADAVAPETIQDNFHEVKNIEITFAIHTCWLSLLTDVLSQWQQKAQQQDDDMAALADNPLFRRKLIDAWMELEVARSVHEEALSATDEQKTNSADLARQWLLRCLNMFIAELPYDLHTEEEPWQQQARKFIQGHNLSNLRNGKGI